MLGKVMLGYVKLERNSIQKNTFLEIMTLVINVTKYGLLHFSGNIELTNIVIKPATLETF